VKLLFFCVQNYSSITGRVGEKDKIDERLVAERRGMRVWRGAMHLRGADLAVSTISSEIVDVSMHKAALIHNSHN